MVYIREDGIRGNLTNTHRLPVRKKGQNSPGPEEAMLMDAMTRPFNLCQSMTRTESAFPTS